MFRRERIPVWIAVIVLASMSLMGQGWSQESAPPAPVPKTGQTTCYDSDGAVIPCTGTGQDGEFQKGVTPPTPRFTDNANGTVTDNLTGLIWTKNANCDGSTMTWNSALSLCNALAASGGVCEPGICGLGDGSVAGDWRLPNVRELHSLIDYGNFDPALPAGHPFTNVQTGDWYWSSTTVAYDTGFVWNVHFYHGEMNNDTVRTYPLYVWCVRGGQ